MIIGLVEQPQGAVSPGCVPARAWSPDTDLDPHHDHGGDEEMMQALNGPEWAAETDFQVAGRLQADDQPVQFG